MIFFGVEVRTGGEGAFILVFPFMRRTWVQELSLWEKNTLSIVRFASVWSELPIQIQL